MAAPIGRSALKPVAALALEIPVASSLAVLLLYASGMTDPWRGTGILRLGATAVEVPVAIVAWAGERGLSGTLTVDAFIQFSDHTPELILDGQPPLAVTLGRVTHHQGVNSKTATTVRFETAG
jgi:hypothetical protein